LPSPRRRIRPSTVPFSSSSSREEDHSLSEFPLTISGTSGRRKKRLQRLQRQQKGSSGGASVGEKLHQRKIHEKEEEEDNRTWKTILFPSVHDEPGALQEPPLNWPKTPVGWRKLLRDAWRIYSGTWEGFFSNYKRTKTTSGDMDGQEQETAGEVVSKNVHRNVQFTREQGGKAMSDVQERTGIYTLEDLKQLAREMMTVATKMLTEFMAEYRKGRDEEVEKMMHEYFQEEEEDQDKKDGDGKEGRRRKRRAKRRIPISTA
jgi:hypothetical protein